MSIYAIGAAGAHAQITGSPSARALKTGPNLATQLIQKTLQELGDPASGGYGPSGRLAGAGAATGSRLNASV